MRGAPCRIPLFLEDATLGLCLCCAGTYSTTYTTTPTNIYDNDNWMLYTDQTLYSLFDTTFDEEEISCSFSLIGNCYKHVDQCVELSRLKRSIE